MTPGRIGDCLRGVPGSVAEPVSVWLLASEQPSDLSRVYQRFDFELGLFDARRPEIHLKIKWNHFQP